MAYWHLSGIFWTYLFMLILVELICTYLFLLVLYKTYCSELNLGIPYVYLSELFCTCWSLLLIGTYCSCELNLGNPCVFLSELELHLYPPLTIKWTSWTWNNTCRIRVDSWLVVYVFSFMPLWNYALLWDLHIFLHWGFTRNEIWFNWAKLAIGNQID